MNADGSGQRRLPWRPVRADGHAWSPDGQKIAFASGVTRPQPTIYVMNADGSGQRKLTPTAGGKSPAWSPDGRKIAFVCGPSGTRSTS